MDLSRLTFVTSNLDKVREAEAILGVTLDHQALDLTEIQSLDLRAVAVDKAERAYHELRRPVLVEDTGLELDALGGFPGPLVRWLLGAVGADGIATLATTFGGHRAAARCLAVAFDGSEPVIGEGLVEGVIVDPPRGGGGFGWDPAFAPDTAGGATYGELDDAAKNRISHRRLALEALRTALG